MAKCPYCDVGARLIFGTRYRCHACRRTSSVRHNLLSALAGSAVIFVAGFGTFGLIRPAWPVPLAVLVGCAIGLIGCATTAYVRMRWCALDPDVS